MCIAPNNQELEFLGTNDYTGDFNAMEYHKAVSRADGSSPADEFASYRNIPGLDLVLVKTLKGAHPNTQNLDPKHDLYLSQAAINYIAPHTYDQFFRSNGLATPT
ncbi:hypothetical protein NEDG_01686 [Nematocida displodere]|uniref:Uncharacterized protein n=1 Tax=Nematocida displodere TaxID=1805483 RepID=A0A177EDR5_9MICR|nr:hypothetical protein NEDG_01686 [Nematocida displodere]